jgi:hypothetical protein
MYRTAFNVIAVILTFGLVAGANAQSAFQNAVTVSASDASHEVSEPTITAQTVNGQTYSLAAWIRGPHPLAPDIHVTTAWTTDPTHAWGNQQVLPPAHMFVGGEIRSIDQSGDPVWAVDPNGGFAYLVTTTSDNHAPIKDNQITIWRNDPGLSGSWSDLVAVAPHPAPAVGPATVHFDDKPTALMSQYAATTGMIYVAFVDQKSTCDSTLSFCTPAGQTIELYLYSPGGFGLQYMGSIASGTNIQNPILYQDTDTGLLWLSYQDFSQHPYKMVFKMGSNYGWIWNDYDTIVDDEMLRTDQLQIVENPADPHEEHGKGFICDDESPRKCIFSPMGMAGGINRYGELFIAWHRRKPGTAWGTEIRYTWGSPQRWFPIANIAASDFSSHYLFNPAISFDDNAAAFVTYYDYDHSQSPQHLQYTLRATKISERGLRLADVKFFGWLSDANAYTYNCPFCQPAITRLGEYQGVYYTNGTFNAVTVLIQNGVGNIYNLQSQ